MTAERWERRIERARELAAAYPYAQEGLRFYEQVAGFQRSLYESFGIGAAAKADRPPGSLREEIELFSLLPWFGSFLAFIQDVGPGPLAESAGALAAAGSGRWEEVLDELWREAAGTPDLPAPEALLAWAFLQPYAEHRADCTLSPEPHGTPPLCPRCGCPPQVGVLRPLGDGGKRSLVCSLCATEWDFRRIVCPACGEEDVEKLPVYTAEEIPLVRVEACDTCHGYIKTVDMTKDGRAVPVVDELAAIPLSLWAGEKGYSKVRGNLLGL